MNALTQSAMPASTAATVPLLRTLVLCDLVDSTALVERLGDQRAAELIRKHDRVVRALLPMRGGREIDKTDGFLAMFDRPIQAVAFALDYQRGLRELNANEKTSLGARVGIHVGDVVTWDNTPDDIAKGAKLTEVEGLVKPITSRLMQLALPGQILLSGVAFSLAHRAQGELGERLSTVRWRTHGRYRFKGIPDPIPVFEVGEEGHAPLKPPPWSGKAHREVPFWRRPATVVVEGALVLALVAIPLWYVFKPAPAIAFANRDWVVVGDLKNLTGQASFDESLETAFRIGLEQSRYVNVLSDLKTRETVKLMQRDPEQTQIDRAVGSEVAIRDGARALILPTVAEIGGRVRVTAEVIDPQTQTTVYSESADGVGEGSVLPSLDKVNQQLRVRLGEALATVSNESQPLEKVVTKNLDALRAFSLAERVYAKGNMKDALPLYKQAIDIDHDFALAHLAVARVYLNTDRDDEAGQETAKALALGSRLSAQDKLHAEAMQATQGNPKLALEKWKALNALYPDKFGGVYGYFAWQNGNVFGAAIEATEKAANQQNPFRGTDQYLLGVLYLGVERYADSIREFKESRAAGVVTQNEFVAMAYAATHDFDGARKALQEGKPSGSARSDATLDVTKLALAVEEGRWDQIENDIDAAKKRAESLDDVARRRVAVVDLSLAPILGDKAGVGGKIDALAASASSGRDVEDQFQLLFAAYVAASTGDTVRAERMIAKASADANAAKFPILGNMKTVAGAELERAKGNSAHAAEMLKALLDDTELNITHVALMDALVAAHDNAGALKEAQWLADRPGRAYAEYGFERVLTPFNVAQAQLGSLRAAELTAIGGDPARAKSAAAAFKNRWPGYVRNPDLVRRINDLTQSKPAAQ